MKRLVLCGIAIVVVLGLMVSTSNAHRGGYYGNRGSRVGAAVGGAVLGGILGGLGARPYPYYYGAPVVHPVVSYPYGSGRPDYDWCVRNRTSRCLRYYPELRD